jgi:predicted ATPase/DNA-binding SARP family transcriptional activator/tetratricopeptide (TPR) repeat protein
MDDVEFAVLGPLEVRLQPRAAPLEIAPQPGRLLARLILTPRKPVSVNEIAFALWDRPADNNVGIHQVVKTARQLLCDSSPFHVLVTVQGGKGYQLEVNEPQTDRYRFERLVTEAAKVVSRQPLAAKALLTDALAMWRGPLLGELWELEWVREHAIRLDDLWLSATVNLCTARFELGEHDALVRDLRGLLAEHPENETLWVLLVRSLVALGRGPEATQAFRKAVLALGSPGRALRDVQDQVFDDVRPTQVTRPRSQPDEIVPPAIARAVLLCAALDDAPEAEQRGLGQAVLVVDEHGGSWSLNGDAHVLARFDEIGPALACARELATGLDRKASVAVHIGGLVTLGDTASGAGPARCWRLAFAGHPGQVLVSPSAREAALRLPRVPALQSLGRHRLADLTPSEEVYELVDPARTAPFPALRTLGASPHNLPERLSRLIGRREELRQIFKRLGNGAPVILTGPGGSGKTALALQVAAYQLGSFEQGAWLVELGALGQDATTEELARVAANDIHVKLLPGETGMAALTRHLDGPALLVLDNCEHVVDACCALIAELRIACPELQILATSREPLRVPGEQVFEVGPMTVPGGRGEDRLADSLVLLLERSGLITREPAPGPAEIHACAQICRLFDGLPLAIELAAPEVATSAVAAAESVRGTVEGKYELADFGSPVRSAPRRQRTLDAAIDWSFQLLAPDEQFVLRRLAVFRESFDREQAVAVAATGALAESRVRAILRRLREKSMLSPSDPDGVRLRLLEPIRVFARDRLYADDDPALVARAHAEAYAMLVMRVAPTLFGPGEQAGLERLEADHDNLRAALHRHIEQHDETAALRMVGGMWWLWFSHGHLAEGCEWVKRALALSGAPSSERARALRAGSHLSWWRGAFEDVATYNERLARCAEEIDDAWALAWAPMGVGAVELFANPVHALELLESSRARFESLGDMWSAAYAQQIVAGAYWYAGDVARARIAFDEALATFERLEHGSVLASVMSFAGLMTALRGEAARGTVLCERALQISAAIGDRAGSARAHNHLGSIARAANDMAEAARHHCRALRLGRSVGELWATCRAIDGLAGVALNRGEPHDAARLLAFASKLASSTRYRPAPLELEVRNRDMARIQDELRLLGADELDRALTEGELLRMREAVACALEYAP